MNNIKNKVKAALLLCGVVVIGAMAWIGFQPGKAEAQPSYVGGASYAGSGIWKYSSGVQLPNGVTYNQNSNILSQAVKVDLLGFKELNIQLTGSNDHNVTNSEILTFGANDDGSTNYVTNLTWTVTITGSTGTSTAMTGLNSTNCGRYEYLLNINTSNTTANVFTNYYLQFLPK